MEWISLLAQLKQQMHKGSRSPRRFKNIVRRMHGKKTRETYGENEMFFREAVANRSSPEKSQKMEFLSD